MKAVGLYRYLASSDPECLVDVELPTPKPSGHDLLVRVRAVALNPVDTKVRSPKPQVETAPRVLGWDASGVVEGTGPDCSLFKVGDEVYYAGDITRPGCNSELHLVDERIVGKKPKSLPFAEAAALPLTTITAWEGLFDRLGISAKGDHAGRSLLIIGGAGGVGSIAIQLAKTLAKLEVIATASRPESADWCRSLGADHVIDHFKDMASELQKLGHSGVDYIFCLNDTDHHFAGMARCIKAQGRICSIVETKAPVDLLLLKSKSAGFIWELMFTRPMFKTEDMIEQHRLLNSVAELVDAGKIKTTLSEVVRPINAANLRNGHIQQEKGRSIGKLVLEGF